MKLLYISIIESIYLSYMFHFLKTSVDFNIFDSPSNIFFKHAIGNQKTYRICPFGQYMIIILIVLLLVRNFIPISKKIVIKGIGIAFILSFMNMNALVYLLPVVILEYCNYFT